VLVSGSPGAGKTSLAVPLAAELGFGLLCRDRIKEALHDALGAAGCDLPGRGSWARQPWSCSGSLPPMLPQPCLTNFRPYKQLDRAATCHPVHVLTSLTPEDLGEYDRPVGLGELVLVDTTAPVDVAALAELVRARLLARGTAAGSRLTAE
jgi:hypothetical protein